MGVCALVLEAGGDEDQAIAALLHDAVEDQGGLATLETIHQLFGQRVAAAVESCSDSTVSDPTKKLPWRERKEKYLAHLRSANADALIVGAADKLHNARAVLTDYRQIGEVKVQCAEGGAIVVLRRIGRGVQANDCAKHACERVGESRQGARGRARMTGTRRGVLLGEVVFGVYS